MVSGLDDNEEAVALDSSLALLACASASAMAIIDDGGRTPKLEPAPKELHLHEGAFHVSAKKLKSTSSSAINRKTASPPKRSPKRGRRTALGLQLEIISMKPEAKAQEGSIVLARLDDKWVRKFLARNGLAADQQVGEEGLHPVL